MRETQRERERERERERVLFPTSVAQTCGEGFKG